MKKLTLLLLTAAIVAVFTLPIAACKKDNSALCNYEIIAEYDGQKTVSAVMNFTYYNDCENEISDLKFNLYANAYRQNARQKPISQTYLDKAFYNGESFGKIEILSVDNCSSWQVCGSDENVLLVSLLTPIYPENTVKISVKYTLELAQVNHRTGVTERAVNLGNFYPVLCHYEKSGFYECEYYSCGDPFVSDCANYTVQLTVPKSYVIASSGNLVKSNESGEKLVCEYELKRARDFAAVLSQNFKTESATLGDCTVTYYYYDDANPQMKLNAAVQSLQYFSDVLVNTFTLL